MQKLDRIAVYPNTHYATPMPSVLQAINQIRVDLKDRLEYFHENMKYIEEQRLRERVNFDIEMMESTGTCRGVENYSRYLSGRAPGQPPPTLFEYLPKAYDNGPKDVLAREKMANAATIAGMAFANAFLGICHSMAHKLGAFHHLPHGVANALMIEEVIRFNASEAPVKMGTFSQYDHPHTLARYAEIADALGLGGKSDEEKLENLIKAINELKAKVGIKATIKDYGIDEQDFLNRLDDMVEQAFDDQCTGANPRYPLMSELKQMYLNAYYGNHFVEKKMPTAADIEEGAKVDEVKVTYRKGKKA